MEKEGFHFIPQPERIQVAFQMANRSKNGQTVAEMSEETGISRSHLYKLGRKFEEDEEMLDKPRTGRPLKYDEHTSCRIVREIEKSPFKIHTKFPIKSTME